MSSSSRYALNKNKYLLDHELQRLEELIETYWWKDSRNTCLLAVALGTGARAQELLNVTPADLNDQEGSVFIRGIKGSNDRELPLKSQIYQQLRQLARQEEAVHLPIFHVSYSRLRQIWDLYRPVHKKFHSLRHTFAIRLYKKTRDIRLVQFALGHRNITNTMIYADYVYSQEELRKLIL